jgi:rod shape-determining protein MreC
VPVEIERTGLRTIAVGTGTGLALPYLPANADVKQGDLLITSGLGGVFPQGYPVGRVSGVSREAVQPLAQVRATPLARLDRVREVMLVWFRPEHPAAPGTTTGADLKEGDPKALPQRAPPKAASPAPETTSADAPKAGDRVAPSGPPKPASEVATSTPPKPEGAVAATSTAPKTATGVATSVPTPKPSTSAGANASKPGAPSATADTAATAAQEAAR